MAKKKAVKKVKAVTLNKMNGARGATVTSPDAMAASGESKSVTCHGFGTR